MNQVALQIDYLRGEMKRKITIVFRGSLMAEDFENLEVDLELDPNATKRPLTEEEFTTLQAAIYRLLPKIKEFVE